LNSGDEKDRNLKKYFAESQANDPDLAYKLAARWITARLKHLEKKLEKLESGVERGLLDAERYPYGYAMLKKNYAWERELLEGLLHDVQEVPFPEVLRSRKKHLETGPDIPGLNGSVVQRKEYYRRNFEDGLLREITRDWTKLVQSLLKSNVTQHIDTNNRKPITARWAVEGEKP
jgi:hypothetical protein